MYKILLVECAMKKLISVIILISMFAGCANKLTNEDSGIMSGAVIGGLVGRNFGKGGGRVVATGIGMMMGAAIGGEIGRQMDDGDKRKMRDALEYEPIDKQTRWQNPDSKVVYTVTPKRTFYAHDTQGNSQPCREYTTTAIIGGKKETVYGTACRTADGAWKIK